MTVRFEGVIPGAEGPAGLAAFNVTAEAPGAPPVSVTVATDAPLFSFAAEWALNELRNAFAAGPAGYVESEKARMKELTKEGVTPAPPEEMERLARDLHAVASAAGAAGLEEAGRLLELAKTQDMADFEAAQLERLEKERREVSKRIERLERRKRGSR